MAAHSYTKQTSDTTGEAGIAYMSGTVCDQVPAVRWELSKTPSGATAVTFTYVYYAWACAKPEHPKHVRLHPVTWGTDYTMAEVMAEAAKLAKDYTERQAMID